MVTLCRRRRRRFHAITETPLLPSHLERESLPLLTLLRLWDLKTKRKHKAPVRPAWVGAAAQPAFLFERPHANAVLRPSMASDPSRQVRAIDRRRPARPGRVRLACAVRL